MPVPDPNNWHYHERLPRLIHPKRSRRRIAYTRLEKSIRASICGNGRNTFYLARQSMKRRAGLPRYLWKELSPHTGIWRHHRLWRMTDHNRHLSRNDDRKTFLKACHHYSSKEFACKKTKPRLWSSSSWWLDSSVCTLNIRPDLREYRRMCPRFQNHQKNTSKMNGDNRGSYWVLEGSGSVAQEALLELQA